jgi:hypothetical protein
LVVVSGVTMEAVSFLAGAGIAERDNVRDSSPRLL